MKVFLSHCSLDKPRIEDFAIRLRTEYGIDVWYDKWEIAKGDDVVEKMNEGLKQCESALIVLSHNTDNLNNGPWAAQERSALIYDRVNDKKRVIPILLDENAQRPPLLQTLSFATIHEIEEIAAALKGKRPPKPALGQPSAAPVHRITVALREQPPGQLSVAVQINQSSFNGPALAEIPPAIQAGLQRFREGLPRQLVRQTPHEGRAAMEGWLAQLGRDLGQLCLPGGAGTELQTLLKNSPLGTRYDVVFEADRPEWLGLPFETLRLPDDTRLALHPGVATWRRLAAAPSANPTQITALAHPLKVLVAVGAPDEDKTKANVLDHEREMQVILDAVEPVQQHKNCEVRILEVGHPDEIAKALKADPYHVLHLSCHGSQGQLLLETEIGEELPVTPAELVAALRRGEKVIPLVFLNACHTGVASPQSAGFALELLRAGVPAVVATLAPISDAYATQLAGAFYQQLAKTETTRPAQALAAARQECENLRQKLLSTGRAEEAGFPEYGTATLFLAGDDRPLVNGDVDRVKLKTRSINMLQGELPAWQRGDLIGRRQELREALGFLRDKEGSPGVLLQGIGGLGKSALAGRIAMAQREHHWAIAIHRGEFDVGRVAREVADALEGSSSKAKAKRLSDPELDDNSRIRLLRELFQAEHILLILDDFEQNLSFGGKKLNRPEVATVLNELLAGAVKGRLLVTCRYGLKGAQDCEVLEALLAEVSLRPLSPAEVRKLVQRLTWLRGQDPQLLWQVVRGIGGHPRMLEFLNALLRHSAGGAKAGGGGSNRLSHVWSRMVTLAKKEGIDLARGEVTLEEQAQTALRLGQRDILLGELVEVARQAGDAEALFQAAVSNLPVTRDELAGMLGKPSQAVTPHWERLHSLSLLTVMTETTALVPRWTAQGLQHFQSEEEYRTRCVRAGDYRVWQVQNVSRSIEHGIEAYRNYFNGGAIDHGAEIALDLLRALDRFGQTVALAVIVGEVLERVPVEHERFGPLADLEAQAHLRLGDTQRAKQRYLELLAQHTARATANPDRADYQRHLSVSYERMGVLYHALGDGPAARDAFAKSLDIALTLAQAEPDRSDYQRDLSVAYNKMGDLYRDLGDVSAARDAFGQSLDIRLKLAQANPDRADYQRHLSVSYDSMGVLYHALGDGPAARDAFGQSLEILLKLAQVEPDRADYQYDLGAVYDHLGALYRTLGDGRAARDPFEKALTIAQKLAQAEPDRVDYQRTLSVSYNNLGYLYRALGDGAAARDPVEKSLAIMQKLAQAEPDRSDYQRDLSVAYSRLGQLELEEGNVAAARDAFEKDLQIAVRLATVEPARADYQVDVVISLLQIARLLDDRRQPLGRALQILEDLERTHRLAPAQRPMLEQLREVKRDLDGESA